MKGILLVACALLLCNHAIVGFTASKDGTPIAWNPGEITEPASRRSNFEYSTCGEIWCIPTLGGSQSGWAGWSIAHLWFELDTVLDHLDVPVCGPPTGSYGWVLWLDTPFPPPDGPWSAQYHGEFVPWCADPWTYPPTQYTDVHLPWICVPAGSSVVFGFENTGMQGMIPFNGIETFGWWNGQWTSDAHYGRTTVIQVRGEAYPPSGACCLPDGSCILSMAVTCGDVGGVYVGGPCTPNPCTLGACCAPDGSCFLNLQVHCPYPNSWLGPGTVCDPNPCEPILGACCASDGSCSITLPTDCTSPSEWMGPGTTCDPNPCEPILGACCAPDGSCSITLSTDCMAPSYWMGPDTTCNPNPCEPISWLWGQMVAQGSPPSGRANMGAVYDPVLQRMLIFGGYNGSYLNDVWELSLGSSPAWAGLTPSGTPPAGREGVTAIHDPIGRRMIAFGGYGNGVRRNDVWSLSLDGDPVWTQLAPQGTPPTGRAGHTAIYDPSGHRMIVFGGDDGNYRNDVWALSLGASPSWTLLPLHGVPPPGRQSASAIYDPNGGRMIVYGGGGVVTYSDVWELSLGPDPTWLQIVPLGGDAGERSGHTAVYDPGRSRMLVFAGLHSSHGPENDIWALTLTGDATWQQIPPGGNPPSPRYWHAAIWDAAEARMVVFGGAAQTRYYANDAWELGFVGVSYVATDPPPDRSRIRISPNPTASGARVEFDLGESSSVELGVYDASGRLLRMLAAGTMTPGPFVVAWDGRDNDGRPVAAGVYFVRLRTRGFDERRPLIIGR